MILILSVPNRSHFICYSNYTELLAEAAAVKSSEEQQTETEAKTVSGDANEMQRKFAEFIDDVQPLLATPDTEPTESITTSKSVTDTSVSECLAYLHLIDFDQKDTESISDLQSLFELLLPYVSFQRFHILEMIVGHFKSKRARDTTQKYHDLLKAYQSQVNLGNFVQSVAKQTLQQNPPFMRTFRLQLESQWATCTLQDLEELLIRILPKSIGHTFVWFCKASQLDDNSIRLDYIVSPSVVELLNGEAKRKRGILRSAGILGLSIDGANFTPKVRILHAIFEPGCMKRTYKNSIPGIQYLCIHSKFSYKEKG